MPDTQATAKRALRRTLLARRSARSAASVAAYGEQLAAAALAAPEVAGVVARGGCVAAYVGVGSEPPTVPLLDALRAGGVRVLLPVLQADWSMLWGRYGGRPALVASPRGLLEPAPPYVSLGEADLILLPGLAVGPDGARLGRGGGAYDRALVSASPAAARLVLLYPDEVGIPVPSEPHDQPVDGAITADGPWRPSSR